MRNCGYRTVVHEAVELGLKTDWTADESMTAVWTVTPAIDRTLDTGSDANWRFLSIYDEVLTQGTVYTVNVQGEIVL